MKKYRIEDKSQIFSRFELSKMAIELKHRYVQILRINTIFHIDQNIQLQLFFVCVADAKRYIVRKKKSNAYRLQTNIGFVSHRNVMN